MSSDVFQELTTFSLFDGINPQTLENLGITPMCRVLCDGEFLFHEDETSADVYFVVSGYLLCVLFSNQGQEITFSRMGAGQYLGEISAIDGNPRSLSAYARNETSIIIISRADFMTIIDAVKEVRNRVMLNLTAMIRRLTARSYETVSLPVDARVRSFLVKLALENSALCDGGEIPNAPTHSEIASQIGANREAVSRAVSALKKSGLIDAGRQKLRILRSEPLLASLNI